MREQVPTVYCDVNAIDECELCAGHIDVPPEIWAAGVVRVVQFVRRHDWAALPEDDAKRSGRWMYACPQCVRAKLFRGVG